MHNKESHKQMSTDNSLYFSKSFPRKIWNFLWNDEGWLSFFANVILILILVRFIIYPVLGAILGTSYPIVAVISGSMEHDGTFEQWWVSECYGKSFINQYTQQQFYANKNITLDIFNSFSLRNGFNKGDLMILSSAKNVKIGDVIVFSSSLAPEPIIHRIIFIDSNKNTITTKGDHNCASASYEQNTPKEVLLGKAVFRIPLLGWLKIGFINFISLFIGG